MASDLAEALHVGLTRLPHVNQESSWEELIFSLYAAAGFKIAGAARAMGVSPTTFSRWRNWVFDTEKGVKQRPSVSKLAMTKAIRRLALTPERERKIKQKQLKMRLWALMGRSEYFNKRKGAQVGNYFPEGPALHWPNGVMPAIIDAWLEGDDDEADQLIRAAVRQFYEGVEIASCDRMEFHE